jgi:hypothetical protein
MQSALNSLRRLRSPKSNSAAAQNEPPSNGHRSVSCADALAAPLVVVMVRSAPAEAVQGFVPA